jgi:hypothetical protein
MAPCIIAGPTCDRSACFEKTPYPLLVPAIGDKVLIEAAGAYTATYSSVGSNGYPPLRQRDLTIAVPRESAAPTGGSTVRAPSRVLYAGLVPSAATTASSSSDWTEVLIRTATISAVSSRADPSITLTGYLAASSFSERSSRAPGTAAAVV